MPTVTVVFLSAINSKDMPMELSNWVVYLLLVTLTAFFFCLGCPLSVLQSHSQRYVKLLKLKKSAVSQSPATELRCHSRVCYQSCTGLLWLMAISFDTGNYCALVLKNYSS